MDSKPLCLVSIIFNHFNGNGRQNIEEHLILPFKQVVQSILLSSSYSICAREKRFYNAMISKKKEKEEILLT